MPDTTVTPVDNGPYKVVGAIQLVDAEGNVVGTKDQTFLCRCGASANKPFCDGTHNKIEFKDVVRAS